MAETEKLLNVRVATRLRWLRPRWIAFGVLGLPSLVFGLSVLLTPPLEPPTARNLPINQPDAAGLESARAHAASLAWPEETLEGAPAKQLLLSMLLAARERLLAVPGYTATFRRRERIDGRLGDPQVIALKIRSQPFGVYMRFVEPEAGKEVVYAQGRYDNDVMAHPGGLARAFLPRLKVAPDSRLALAGNRHPITDAGLLSLTDRLIGYREMDLKDPEATTVLDRWTDPEGRNWLRSIHDHPRPSPSRPFKYVEILYDPETRIPVKISSYDWPAPGHSGDLDLAEQYFYDDLDLDAPLSDLDFDPANPDYDFKRF